MTAYGKRLTSSRVEQIPKEQLFTLELDPIGIRHHSIHHVQARPPASEGMHPDNRDFKENCWHSISFDAQEIIDRFKEGYFNVTYPEKEDDAQLFVWVGDKDSEGEIFATCIITIEPHTDASLIEALTLIAYGVALSSDRYNDDLTPIVLGYYDQTSFDDAMKVAWEKLRNACLSGKIALKGRPEGKARYEDIPANYFHNDGTGPTFFDNTIWHNPRDLNSLLEGNLDTSWTDVRVMTDALRRVFPEVNTPVWERKLKGSQERVANGPIRTRKTGPKPKPFVPVMRETFQRLDARAEGLNAYTYEKLLSLIKEACNKKAVEAPSLSTMRVHLQRFLDEKKQRAIDS